MSTKEKTERRMKNDDEAVVEEVRKRYTAFATAGTSCRAPQVPNCLASCPAVCESVPQ